MKEMDLAPGIPMKETISMMLEDITCQLNNCEDTVKYIACNLDINEGHEVGTVIKSPECTIEVVSNLRDQANRINHWVKSIESSLF